MPRCKFAAWLARPANRVAVVGASGWIGMALVDQIVATAPGLAPDRLRLFGSQARAMAVRSRDLAVETLDGASSLGEGCWLVLHAGIIGADRVENGDLGEVRRRNDAMLDQVLALAETGRTDRMVFFSSGAAGRPDIGGPARQAYARMKLQHEAEVTAWGASTDRRVLIPRVFNLGGPYINHTHAYALGDFILQCARDGRIRIGASHRVWRTFVHVTEMARGLLHMAADGREADAPFDVALPRLVELDDLALAVGRALGVEPIIERPPMILTNDDDYSGDVGRFLQVLQGRGEGLVSLDDIVADTVAYLRRTGELPPLQTPGSKA
jgi:nucleoside-diphosphate-sugar epimerase